MRLLRLALPLLIVLLSGYNASSQPTKPQVCLPVAQAAKIDDSLAVLPVVRREAATWQQAAGHFRTAADSLRTADALHQRAARALSAALQDERLVTANETAKATQAQGRAQRRGFLNYLLAAVAGGSLYLLFTR